MSVAFRWRHRAFWVGVTSLLPIVLPRMADGQDAAADESQQTPSVEIAISNSHLGYTYFGQSGIRYLVTQIEVTNVSNVEQSIPVNAFVLRVEGVPYEPDIEHPKLTGYEFRLNDELHRFRELERTESLTLSAGTSGTAWLVFTDLPRTAEVPRLELVMNAGVATHTIDVNRHYEDLMRLEVERIGPRQALGLLTIHGRLNTISVGSLVRRIDQLAAARITRVVVTFAEKAPKPDDPLGDWLRQTAEGIRTNRTYSAYPAIVSTIREFHVAAVPGMGTSGLSGQVHATPAAAAEAALASAYRGLSADEVVAEIEHGHPFAQASALVNGGADLPEEHLPLLLSRAASDDRPIRRGAVIALSGSGDERAIEALVEQAAGADAQGGVLAVECLAASRFSSAHRELALLLDEELAVDDVSLIRILARYPRPEWAEFLAELASARSDVAPDVRREAVAALGKIGHPDLGEILADALRSPDEALQGTAFQLLLSRDDPVSEQVALEYALTRLEAVQPTPQMLQLFDRVRDPRVSPRLVALLDQEEWDRNAVINTLARVGSSNVADELADRFDSFKPNERTAVLSSLTSLNSPRLVPLAEASLPSEHDGLFNGAARSLGLHASEESVDALVRWLKVEEQASRIGTIAKALEDVGTQQAIRGLEAAKNESQGEKRSILHRRLLALRLKSPGGLHLQRANQFVEEDEHAKAVEQFTLAIAHDPDLSPAYSGRGHCHLRLEQFDQAREDFRRGMELDPDDGLAVAGLGITLAIKGEIDKAVEVVEEASKRFEKDVLFAYNAACVYGRVLEHLSQDPTTDDAKDKRRQMERQALERLRASIEMGFEEYDWMKQDPDLASLRGLAEFQQLVSPADDAESGEKPVEP